MRTRVDGEIVGPTGQEEVAVAVLRVLGQGDGGCRYIDEDGARAHIDPLAVAIGRRALLERLGHVVGVAGIDQLDRAIDEDGLGPMATGDALDDVERRARVAVVGTARELEGDGPKDLLSAGSRDGAHDVGLGVEQDAALLGA